MNAEIHFRHHVTSQPSGRRRVQRPKVLISSPVNSDKPLPLYSSHFLSKSKVFYTAVCVGVVELGSARARCLLTDQLGPDSGNGNGEHHRHERQKNGSVVAFRSHVVHRDSLLLLRFPRFLLFPFFPHPPHTLPVPPPPPPAVVEVARITRHVTRVADVVAAEAAEYFL